MLPLRWFYAPATSRPGQMVEMLEGALRQLRGRAICRLDGHCVPNWPEAIALRLDRPNCLRCDRRIVARHLDA
jgi:hypothetical protein